MNSFLQKFLLYTFPFYPIWAWFFTLFTSKSFDFFFALLVLPFSAYFIITNRNRIPNYLAFFIVFTVFHIISAFVNNTVPENSHWLYFIFTDFNVIACIVLIAVENVFYSRKFISQLNTHLLIVVILSLMVSLIQLKNPLFFFNQGSDPDWGLGYIEESRIYSIYSWVNYHTLGASFPILIAILLSQYILNKESNYYLILILLMGFVVCFLSRYRFAIIAALLVSSQMFFIKFKNKVSLFLIAIISLVGLVFVAQVSGFEIQEVIDNRILEKDSDLSSAHARLTSYNVFLLKYPEHPILGVGPKTKPDVVALLDEETPVIHIGYLCYLYFYGIVGTLFLLISLFYLLKSAWIVGKKNNFWGSFFGLVSFCIGNTMFVYFNFAEMGIVLSIIYIRYYTYSFPQAEQLVLSAETKRVPVAKPVPAELDTPYERGSRYWSVGYN